MEIAISTKNVSYDLNKKVIVNKTFGQNQHPVLKTAILWQVPTGISSRFYLQGSATPLFIQVQHNTCLPSCHELELL